MAAFPKSEKTMVLSWNRRIFAAEFEGNEAVSVAPASPGNHLAARLETPSDVHFLKIIRNMEAKNIHSNKPRLVGSIIEEMLQGWYKNTDLAVDLKTILRSDRRMQTGKEYQGVIRRDSDGDIDDFRCRDAHYTFIETVPQPSQKRNPHVFEGKFITVTRRDDGSLKPNFRPLKVDRDFSVYRYALGVFNELMWALEDLIEKR